MARARPLRVCFVSHSLPPRDRPLQSVGGIQRVNMDLLQALGAVPEVELVPVVMRGAWSQRHWRVPLFLLDAVRTVGRLARRGEIDVVLFSSMVTGALALPLRRRLHRAGVSCAVIAYGHDVTMPSAIYQRLVPRIFRSVNGVLPISSATADACIARGAEPSRVTTVSLGVDRSRFELTTDRTAARRALLDVHGGSLADDALLLCSVGRQIPRKGFAWFVGEVMPLLGPRIHYWLAGDGPEQAAIRRAVERHGLGQRVRILGRLPDDQVALLYAAADLFVMPNVPVPGDMEGFGLVMLEAGVSGVPSLASRLEGITDVVSEGENGHLLPSGDAAAFAERIHGYDRDRTALEHARRRARDHTLANFGWQAAAHRYLEALAALRQEGRTIRGQ